MTLLRTKGERLRKEPFVFPIVRSKGLRYTAQCGSRSRINPYTHVPTTANRKVMEMAPKPAPIWAKSGPGQAPVMAQPKPKISPPCPPLVEFLRTYHDRFTVHRSCLEAFDEDDTYRSYQNGRADDTVHVEALEAEHLLDPEPTDDLGLHEDHTEHQAPRRVLQIVPPRMLKLRLVHAYGIQ